MSTLAVLLTFSHPVDRSTLQVEKVMKSLHVRRLSLWPRFHAYVQEELDAAGPEVGGDRERVHGGGCRIKGDSPDRE